MNIIELAKKSGIQEWWGEPDEFYDEFCEMLERFAALVRADERNKIFGQVKDIQSTTDMVNQLIAVLKDTK